jgi:hypothetical protein
MRIVTISLLFFTIVASTGCNRDTPQTKPAVSATPKPEESQPAVSKPGLAEQRQAFIDYMDGKTIQLTSEIAHVLKREELENVDCSGSTVYSEVDGKRTPTAGHATFVLNVGATRYTIKGQTLFKESDQVCTFVGFYLRSVEKQE